MKKRPMFPDWTTNGVYIVVGVLRLISPRLLTDRARSFFSSLILFHHSILHSLLFLFLCVFIVDCHPHAPSDYLSSFLIFASGNDSIL